MTPQRLFALQALLPDVHFYIVGGGRDYEVWECRERPPHPSWGRGFTRADAFAAYVEAVS